MKTFSLSWQGSTLFLRLMFHQQMRSGGNSATKGPLPEGVLGPRKKWDHSQTDG